MQNPRCSLNADREGASQSVTAQSARQNRRQTVGGDRRLRLARLPQTLHGFRMWVTVKDGDRTICGFELKDNANWETGGSKLLLKAGDANATLVNDAGVYTAGQTAKTDIFGKAFTSFILAAATGNIILRLGDKEAYVPVTQWQHPTSLEFGCHSTTQAVEFGIGNLQYAIE